MKIIYLTKLYLSLSLTLTCFLYIGCTGDVEGNVDKGIGLRDVNVRFTFSLVGYSKELQELKGGTGEEKLGYFYLSHWEDEGVNGKLYDYKMGLNNRALKDITFI